MKDERNIDKNVKPRTYYQEIGEYGYLEEYLLEFQQKRMREDEKFRMEMYDLLQKFSEKPIVDIDSYYLEHLCRRMEYFLEYTKPWRTQKP